MLIKKLIMKNNLTLKERISPEKFETHLSDVISMANEIINRFVCDRRIKDASLKASLTNCIRHKSIGFMLCRHELEEAVKNPIHAGNGRAILLMKSIIELLDGISEVLMVDLAIVSGFDRISWVVHSSRLIESIDTMLIKGKDRVGLDFAAKVHWSVT